MTATEKEKKSNLCNISANLRILQNRLYLEKTIAKTQRKNRQGIREDY